MTCLEYIDIEESTIFDIGNIEKFYIKDIQTSIYINTISGIYIALSNEEEKVFLLTYNECLKNIKVGDLCNNKNLDFEQTKKSLSLISYLLNEEMSEDLSHNISILDSTDVVLNLELTYKCNLKCSHCYQTESSSELIKYNKDSYVDFFKIKKIIAIMENKFDNFTVCLSGGEPTLHPNFIEIINILKESKKKIEIILMTNGTTLDKLLNKDNNLIEKIDTFKISVDGFSKEIFEKIRGINTYNKIITNLHEILKYDKEIVLAVSVNRINMEDIMNNLHGFLIENNFINKVSIGFGMIESIGSGKKLENLTLYEFNHFYFQVLKKYTSDFKIKTLCDYESTTTYSSHCLLSQNLTMNPDGKISACMPFDGFDLNIDNNLDFDKFSQKILEIKGQKEKSELKCNSCIIKKHCDFGCLFMNYLSYNSFGRKCSNDEFNGVLINMAADQIFGEVNIGSI